MTTIWWFRAVCYQREGLEGELEKYTGEWMKNVPDVKIDELNNLLELGSIPMIDAHGEILNENANTITECGFRILKDYNGDLLGANFYTGILSNFQVIDKLTKHTMLGGLTGSEIIGYTWTGKFYRDAKKAHTETGEYDMMLGGGMTGEGFGKDLLMKDTYLIQAMAKNDLGWGFSDPEEITTLGVDAVESIDDEKISDTLFEKTVKLGNISNVIRVGIRLGRTMGCNELHYFKDGNFSPYEQVVFLVELEPNSKYYIMPYVVVDYGTHQKEIPGMMNYLDPENESEYLNKFPVEITEELEEDKEENLLKTRSGGGNVDYRTITSEILCEKMGDQSLIDYYGRRRSYTVNNHLIQTKPVCCAIADDYVTKYQHLKLRVTLNTPLLIPLEQEDVILLTDSNIPFRTWENRMIPFSESGKTFTKPHILAKVRKLDISYTGTNAIMNLELEV